MSDHAAAAPPAVDETRRTDETKAIIRSVVGTGIGLATLLLMLAGLMIQQNANLNARIDDINANVNARIDDVNTRIDDVKADLNARIDNVNANLNARIDDLNANLNARIDDLREDIRELRALLIEAIQGEAPAG